MATAKYRIELVTVRGKRKYLELELKVPYAVDEEHFRYAMSDGDAKLADHLTCSLDTALAEWFIDQAELSDVIEFDPPEYDDD